MKYIALLLLFLGMGVSLSPAQSNAKDLLKKAWTQIDEGDYEGAKSSCSQLLFQDPDNPKYILLRGVLNVSYQDYEAGLDDLNFAIKKGCKDPKAFIYRAIALLSYGKFDEAEKDMQKAISIDPQNTASYRARAAMRSRLGQTGLALQDVDRALKIEPDDYKNHYSKGLVLFDRGDYAAAYKELATSVKMAGKSFYKTELLLAECASKGEDDALAEKHIRQAMHEDSTVSRPWYALGQLRERQSRWEEAKTCYLKGIAINRKASPSYGGMASYYAQAHDDARAIAYLDSALALEDLSYYHLQRGQALFRTQQLELALTDFDYLVTKAPQTEGGYFWRGKTYLEMGQLKDAIADFKTCLRLSPDWDEPLLFLARSESLAADFEQARKHLTEFTKRFSEDPRGWFLFGNMAYDQGNYAEAILKLTSALSTHYPDSVWIYAHRADCYQGLGDSARASQDLDTIIHLRTLNAHELTTLGYGLGLAGRYTEAITYSDQALALDSTLAYAYNNRGFAKLKLGQYEASISDFDKSALLPNSYYHWPTRNRGNAKRALGRYKEAIADFDLSIGFRKDYAEAYNDRGETWELLGDRDKAIADYRAALQHKPDLAAAQANLDRLQK